MMRKGQGSVEPESATAVGFGGCEPDHQDQIRVAGTRCRLPDSSSPTCTRGQDHQISFVCVVASSCVLPTVHDEQARGLVNASTAYDPARVPHAERAPLSFHLESVSPRSTSSQRQTRHEDERRCGLPLSASLPSLIRVSSSRLSQQRPSSQSTIF